LSGKISKVYYPGFKNHPGHEIHRSQADGDGAVVTFTTGDEEFSKRIVEATKLFAIAVSFGSVGSTISLPYRMSHASIPEALKDRLAPPADLVRLSIGIEDANDLLEDLQQAFTVAGQQRVAAASASNHSPQENGLWS
jgi:cystathionine beta-lyase